MTQKAARNFSLESSPSDLRPGLLLVSLLAALFATVPASAQSVILDRAVRAGDLTLFPDVSDENTFYYVSDQARLATDENGTPRFSFLRWVSNVRSADRTREGEGGGIVHAVVSLEVTQEQRREAQRELQRIRPGATLRGPAIFTSGTFGLVSSFAEADGELTRRVVGLGSAPILDGQRAAVSLLLTKEGAKILWESFQSATPDISFSFEMQLDGYRSPRQGRIRANFDQIYEHQGFAAGVASQYLAAEIRGSFDDLRRTGAIEVTQVGAEEKIDELITSAYNKLTDMMFQPVGGTGTPSVASLAGAGGQNGSVLDRATRMLAENRSAAERRNEEIRRENRQLDREEAARREREGRASGGAEGGGGEGGGEGGEGEDDPRPEGSFGGREPASVGEEVAESTGAEPRTPRRQEESVPSFAVVATYEMKRIRQRGSFEIDLDKYTADSLSMRFDRNIGDLTSFLGNDELFREVNLDADLFRQREITVYLDGARAADFADYINFVSVQLKKTHASGDQTFDEVRIDRANFLEQANNFKMLYGWKNDADRTEWLEYEYKVVWSFFGGHNIEGEWQEADLDAIPVSPPLLRRTVTLDADPDIVADEGIRLITVNLFYPLGGEERTVQATLRPRGDQLSAAVDYVSPPETFDYDYEVTWRLRGNRSVASGRQTTNEAVLFVDELPE